MFEHENKTDEEVVLHIQSKDQEVYSVIVERYQAKLIRYINSIVHDEAKASDIIQETFIKAFINLRSFDNNKKFSSWIYRIAHNEAINAIKKNRKEVSFEEDFDIQSDENITDNFEKKEIVSKVEKCISKMSLIYSEPLVLYSIEDKSYEEISDILRIPMGTVATRISRAKILMKNICQKN
jgi:RNA polymerase sigma-70 factor (ECF subfamily)